MKIRNLLSVTAVALLASCNDYDPGLADNAIDYTEIERELLAEFDANFITSYGIPAEGHTWGFGEKGSEDERKTRGSNPNGNEWENTGYKAPAPITDRERAAVVHAFRNHKVSDTSPNYTTFFVQQVYQGGKDCEFIDSLTVENYTYLDGYSQKVSVYNNGNSLMNLLYCGIRTNKNGDSDTGYDHIFDFNSSNSTDYNGCMLMENSATTDFYYHNSYSNEDRHDYICLTVTWTEEDGSTHTGCYVGFDFCCNGETPNQRVARDWKFDDWIVKITPATPLDGTQQENTPPTWHRVMCEDLGNTYDFDFNDLVFDVYFTGTKNDGYIAHVRVQAAGGTLPIYLGYDGDPEYEAHHLMGQNFTNRPINVGKGYDNIPPREITLPASGTYPSTNPDSIDIYVGKLRAEGTKSTILLPKVGKGTSLTPQKICVPAYTRWLREEKLIETAYPHFSEWVTHPDEGGDRPWTTDVIPTNLYY